MLVAFALFIFRQAKAPLRYAHCIPSRIDYADYLSQNAARELCRPPIAQCICNRRRIRCFPSPSGCISGRGQQQVGKAAKRSLISRFPAHRLPQAAAALARSFPPRVRTFPNMASPSIRRPIELVSHSWASKCSRPQQAPRRPPQAQTQASQVRLREGGDVQQPVGAQAGAEAHRVGAEAAARERHRWVFSSLGPCPGPNDGEDGGRSRAY